MMLKRNSEKTYAICWNITIRVDTIKSVLFLGFYALIAFKDRNFCILYTDNSGDKYTYLGQTSSCINCFMVRIMKNNLQKVWLAQSISQARLMRWIQIQLEQNTRVPQRQICNFQHQRSLAKHPGHGTHFLDQTWVPISMHAKTEAMKIQKNEILILLQKQKRTVVNYLAANYGSIFWTRTESSHQPNSQRRGTWSKHSTHFDLFKIMIQTKIP